MTDTLLLETRQLVRRIARAPGLAVTIVLSLAVGMGSVMTILGVADSLFLRVPAGVREPERVVAVGSWAMNDRVAYPDFVDLRDHSRTLESVSAFAVWNYTARVGNGVMPARGLLASHSLLRTLGIRPVAGRFIGPDEDRPGGPPVIVVGARFRSTHFTSDEAALGQWVRLAGIQFTVIGVLPEGFAAPDLSPADFVLPIENAPWFGGREALVNRDYRWVRMVGRLRADATRAAARAEATEIYRRANAGVRSVDQTTLSHEVVAVTSLVQARQDPKSPSARIVTWLAGLAAVVLLVACANVASLLVARGITDAPELAIHLALGAGRTRLVGRAVTEIGLLVLMAVILAMLAASVANANIARLLFANTLAPVPFDLRLAAVAVSVGAVTCAACATAPIFRLVRTDPRTSLGGRSRTATTSHRRALHVLVAAQIALGVVLVSQAAVFAVSLRNATRVDLGTDLSHLVTADVDLRAAGLDTASAPEAERRALNAVRRLPGVVAAGMTNASVLPGFLNPPVRVPGRDSAPPGVGEYGPSVSSVTSGFLDALKVPLVRGRMLTNDDVTGRRPVALVSERFAQAYWGAGVDPIGNCVEISSRSSRAPCAQIVGIIGDRRASVMSDHGEAEVYLPMRSISMPSELTRTFLPRELAVRTDAGRRDRTTDLQRTLLDAVPGLTSVRVRVGIEYLETQMRSWRLGAVIIGVFAAIALLLAGVGVFSAWSHVVAVRRRELGIRGALGALPRALAWLVVRDALMVVVAGVAIGLVGALVATKVVGSMTLASSPADPRVLLSTVALFAVVTCVGSLGPALRAASTDLRTVLASDD